MNERRGKTTKAIRVCVVSLASVATAKQGYTTLPSLSKGEAFYSPVDKITM